eukprot:COSAG03_NODE_4106_length_1683_cov_1.707702_3_plen_82_part_01
MVSVPILRPTSYPKRYPRVAHHCIGRGHRGDGAEERGTLITCCHLCFPRRGEGRLGKPLRACRTGRIKAVLNRRAAVVGRSR